MAAGQLRDAGRRSPPTRSTSRRTSRRTATTRATTTSSPRTGVDNGAGPPAARAASAAATASTRYGATSSFPTQTFQVDQLLGRRGVHDERRRPDTTPPTVTTVSPANGAGGVAAVRTAVTATFSEAMDPATRQREHVRAAQSASTRRSCRHGDLRRRHAHRDVDARAARSPRRRRYTATLRGGGHRPARRRTSPATRWRPTSTWSFTTGAADRAALHRLAEPATTPDRLGRPRYDAAARDWASSSAPIVNGFITGIRFYKGAGNTGTHVGNLWSAGGQLLATATFTSETASGWQQVDFAVAGRRSPPTRSTSRRTSRRTAATRPTAATSRPAASTGRRCTCCATASVGGNGVYAYGRRAAASRTQTFQSTNYWVDVVFTDGGAAGHDAADGDAATRRPAARPASSPARPSRPPSARRWTRRR